MSRYLDIARRALANVRNAKSANSSLPHRTGWRRCNLRQRPIRTIRNSQVRNGRITRSSRNRKSLPGSRDPSRWRLAVEDGSALWARGASRLQVSAGRLATCSASPPHRPTAPELQTPFPLRRDRPRLAVAGQGGGGVHRGHRGDPELDRRHHHVPPLQQAAFWPVGDTLDDLEPPFGGDAA